MDERDPFLNALMGEVRMLLSRLLDDGGPGQIDLMRLPMPPERRQDLQDMLGRGEVEITLDAAGTSLIRETAYAGVWWIEHRDRGGRMVANLIEVAQMPAIVPPTDEEMRASLAALHARDMKEAGR
ncbi:hydrogenase expression/formation C-terminal domain-containing protein [Acidimangrovimonas sediminis]|uniref:hydrogenase expression/formation C-terminal domain-containing protein n=1 Tax=Acidimangrovimonas sediminis TaxID=2056283 RepID=UPI000C80BB61|nr:hydrogenase expression/formation C-terminal domain-containing protein [Acidimangrovimonas sediminis]